MGRRWVLYLLVAALAGCSDGGSGSTSGGHGSSTTLSPAASLPAGSVPESPAREVPADLDALTEDLGLSDEVAACVAVRADAVGDVSAEKVLLEAEGCGRSVAVVPMIVRGFGVDGALSEEQAACVRDRVYAISQGELDAITAAILVPERADGSGRELLELLLEECGL